MKKIVIFLICATLLANSINLFAQNPSCKWNGTSPRFCNLLNNTEYNIINEEGCSFRFELKSPGGFGWFPDSRIHITVDGIDYGSVTLPWGTPYAEVIRLLPSGMVEFRWLGTFMGGNNCFKIYNHENEMIYESPLGLEEDDLFFTYQNECPECLPLTHFEGAYISELKQVNLSWTVPESEYLTGFDIFRNDSLIEHVTKPTNSYSDNTTYLEDGDYKYCVVPVYPYSCMFEKKCFETYISNVGIKSYSSALRLYPNPAKSELRVTSYELREGVVEIFDVYGRIVVNKFPSNTLEGWQPQADGVVINISHLPSGVYFVKLTNEQNSYIQRFIKY